MITQRRIGIVLIWAASTITALGIGLAGVAKFAAPGRWQELFADWGFPQWFLPVAGAIEVAGAVALLIPGISLYGALLLGVVMSGAIITLLMHPTPSFPVALPAVYIVLLTAIATARVRMRTDRLPDVGMDDGEPLS
jgi:uncharacterized membrane protein YphA (DoxX/SURF4 family)